MEYMNLKKNTNVKTNDMKPIILIYMHTSNMPYYFYKNNDMVKNKNIIINASHIYNLKSLSLKIYFWMITTPFSYYSYPH